MDRELFKPLLDYFWVHTRNYIELSITAAACGPPAMQPTQWPTTLASHSSICSVTSGSLGWCPALHVLNGSLNIFDRKMSIPYQFSTDFLNLSLQGFKFFMFERAFSLEINDFAVLSLCAVGLLALLIATFEAKELLVMINSEGSTLLVTYALVTRPWKHSQINTVLLS